MQYPTVDRVMDPMELTARLAKMSSDQLRAYAQMHSDDANVVALALAESKRRQAMKPQPQLRQQPTVLEQTLGQIGQQDVQLPEDVGIGQLPAPNLEGMAEGGIVAFARGGDAGEGKSDPLEVAIRAEGVTDPRQIAFLHAIYGQESSSGKNTKTSNRGARGGMQVTPIAFDDVNRGDLNPDDEFDLARAGVRYALKGYNAAEGDPALAGVHYYSGPGGMQAALEGKARVDKKNPKAPDSLTYGKKIAERFAALLPMGSAQAATSAPATAQPQASGNPFAGQDTVYDPVTGMPMYGSQTTVPDEDITLRERMGLGNIANRKALEAMEAAKRQRNAPATMTPAESQADVDSLLRRHPVPAAQPQHPSSAYDPTGMWNEEAPAAAATPEEQSLFDRLSGNDWMNLGLSLLKSRSPYWQVAAGEAGEAMMAGRRAAEKAALEKQKVENEAAYRDKYIEAISQKDETAGQRIALQALTEASKTAAHDLEKFRASVEFIQLQKNPQALAAKEAEITAKHMLAAQKYVKAITGKDYDFSDIVGGPGRADFTLNPGKGLVPNR